MLTVTNINGQTEILNNYQRLEITEEVNEAFSLAVTSFSIENNPGHALLEEESIITVQDYDFRVKQMRTNKNSKEVVALSTFFDLIGHRQEEIYGGTRTLGEFLNHVFKGTGWTATTDVVDSRFIPNYGVGNVIELVADLTAAFGCEYKIMPNNRVHFAKEVGPDNDAQYRHGHNVKELSHHVDTYNLRTRIAGYGADSLKVTYTSPFAEKYGIIEADPITNDEIHTVADMTELLKNELNDYPEVSIALDSIELTEKEIGERVWLIYEPIKLADGTFMEFQTRVLKKISTNIGGEIVTKSVVIGNTIPRTLSGIIADAKVEIEKNARWTRSRIEQTDYNIELAVEQFTGEILEAYAKIELTATQIRSEVAEIDVRLSDGVAQNKSAITQTATEIRSEVSQEVNRIDGSIASANSSITQLSDQITSVVNTSIPQLDGRINTAESKITQQGNLINLKVSQSDFTGENMVSMINMTPSSVKIQAKNITLVGAVSVLSEIAGNLGTITAGNINISEDVYVGGSIYLGKNLPSGVTRKVVFGKFGDFPSITNHNGSGALSIAAETGINFSTLGGSINFNNNTVTNLNGYARSDTYGLGIAFNGTDRLYVRVNGSNVGFVTLSN
ncbi:phage tail protein [Sporosarcina sp. FSL K6-1522]|uniref:phage tail protein n=1 Tax=Sporosarcina sp. FSL K6-1522 TaxID=2921554 RepID=UPI00315AECC3